MPDSADEPAYLPALEAVGYPLVIRELMLAFQDWLRSHEADRPGAYAATKRELAGQSWTYVPNHARRQVDVVTDILRHAAASGMDRSG